MRKTPYGINRIRSVYPGNDVKTKINGCWVIAVASPYRKNIFESIRAAWWVLTGKAEALVWPEAGELDPVFSVAKKDDK